MSIGAFPMGTGTVDFPMGARIGVPSLTASPSSGASPLTFDWIWSSQSGATLYRLQVSTSPVFASILANITTADAFYAAVGVVGPAVLYGRVRVDAPAVGQWSNTQAVTIT